MERIKVWCGEAKLTAPAWLRKLWPGDMAPEDWPTFCGSGDGFGDAIVPDRIRGVRISPACFLHDVGWATSRDTIGAFLAENWYLARNIRALILAAQLSWWQRELAVVRAWALYFVAVSTFGSFFFDPRSRDDEAPLDNAIVRARLRRLANARIWIEEIEPEAITVDLEEVAV